jgi:large subunit ribosomal protein L31
VSFGVYVSIAAGDALREAAFSAKEKPLTQHPTLYLVDVHCSSCGTTFVTRSATELISADVCSNCHPAYTGKARTLVGGGRIERFNERLARSTS